MLVLIAQYLRDNKLEFHNYWSIEYRMRMVPGSIPARATQRNDAKSSSRQWRLLAVNTAVVSGYGTRFTSHTSSV